MFTSYPCRTTCYGGSMFNNITNKEPLQGVNYVPDPDFLDFGIFFDQNLENFLRLLDLVGLGKDVRHLRVHLVLVVPLQRVLQYLSLTR